MARRRRQRRVSREEPPGLGLLVFLQQCAKLTKGTPKYYGLHSRQFQYEFSTLSLWDTLLFFFFFMIFFPFKFKYSNNYNFMDYLILKNLKHNLYGKVNRTITSDIIFVIFKNKKVIIKRLYKFTFIQFRMFVLH